MLLLRLPRKTGNQSRPQYNIRNLLPEVRDDAPEVRIGCVAAHPFEDFIIRVLNRQIQIVYKLLLVLHALDQFLIDFLRVTIQHSDPTDSPDLRKLMDQLMQTLPTIQIRTVERRLFRNQDQLSDAHVRQILCLGEKTFHRDRTIPSAHHWNCAVGTVLVTSLCNLQICIMTAGCQKPFSIRKRETVDIIQDVIPLSLQNFLDHITDLRD